MFRKNIIENFFYKFLKKKRIILPKSRYNCNYLRENLIDSLQFLEMITEIEKKFKFKFNMKDYNSKSFYTIDKIINIIVRNVKQKKNL